MHVRFAIIAVARDTGALMPDTPTESPSPPPALIIFDDQRGRFGPMTDRRPTFDLQTGAWTSRQRIERALGLSTAAICVPHRLTQVMTQREPGMAVNQPLPPAGDDFLLVNGRWTGGPSLDPSLITALDAPAKVLLDRPWHVLDQLQATLAHDLARMQPGAAAGAKVHPTAYLDQTAGPVVIADGAVIGTMAVLEGPCYIGPGSIVQPQSFIRSHTVIGEYCKVAGEISFSIVHGHTNKAHYGYLGNALVGEWVNLGAGTTVSNLKNTYGEIRVQLAQGEPASAGGACESAAEPTGRTNHGPIIGDFVRTAIGTMIPTGACIGTACMIATSRFAPKFCPAAGFHTDAGCERYDPDKLIATIRAMFARRSMTIDPAEEALIRAVVESA